VVSELVAQGLVFDYPGGRRALSGVELALRPGELVCLLGPNGSGKSTLLLLAAGLLVPSAGAVSLAGRPLAARTARQRAREIAFVPQGLRPLAGIEARAFVLGGRYAHRSPLEIWLGGETSADRAALARALAEADAEELATRRLDELSLGQFQRVLLARALAQEAPLLLFDEPTAALDPEHQVRLFLLIERLVAAGRTALVATHELALAGRFATRCVVLEGGRVVVDADPNRALTPAQLEPVFGRELHFASIAGRPLVVPWPRPRE
jgi:iron complex transport system ATP-binding protein